AETAVWSATAIVSPRAPRTWGWTVVGEDSGASGCPSPTHVEVNRPSKPPTRRTTPALHTRGCEPPYWQILGPLPGSSCRRGSTVVSVFREGKVVTVRLCRSEPQGSHRKGLRRRVGRLCTRTPQ